MIVFADDMGYGDVGCFGDKGIRTPNIDRMAKEGVRFTDFYVAQAVCSASRTALLTGCYPNGVGILGALGPASRIRHQRSRDDHRRHAQDEGLRHGHLRQVAPRASSRSSCRRGTASTSTSACPTRTTCGRTTRQPRFPDLPLIEGEKTIAAEPRPDAS